MLVLIALAIGLFLFCRRRRRTGSVALAAKDVEESIPLNQTVQEEGNGHSAEGQAKGPLRTVEEETIFDVGSDDDGEGEYHGSSRKL